MIISVLELFFELFLYLRAASKSQLKNDVTKDKVLTL